MKLGGVVLATFVAANAAGAAAPAHVDALDREMRVLANVFEAALRDAPGVSRPVRRVEVDYLAGQGALVTLSLSRGWFGSYRVEVGADANGVIAVPGMVHDILADLQIPVSPWDAEELEALRELRKEQRGLRREQREVRKRIRERRRQQALEGNGEAEIEALQRELAGLKAQHEALSADIREQFGEVHEMRKHRALAEADAEGGAESFETALLDAVCSYGDALKSMPMDEHLSVKVRRRENSAFYVFRMKDVLACENDGIDPEALKAAAVIYER